MGLLHICSYYQNNVLTKIDILPLLSSLNFHCFLSVLFHQTQCYIAFKCLLSQCRVVLSTRIAVSTFLGNMNWIQVSWLVTVLILQGDTYGMAINCMQQILLKSSLESIDCAHLGNDGAFVYSVNQTGSVLLCPNKTSVS